MFKKTLFICISTIILCNTGVLFANPMKYDDYLKEATMRCDDAKQPWNQGQREGEASKGLVRKLTFPDFRSGSVNAWMAYQIAQEPSTLGREYLKQALDPGYIGGFDGLKTLEVVQNVYHARMNGLFDCAVIESRIGIILGLKESKALKGSSEILKKLEKEVQKLDILRQQCLPADKEESSQKNPTVYSREINTRMVNTTTLQYCHYRQYLLYLESRLNDDLTQSLETDKEIGTTGTTTMPNTTNTLAAELIQRQGQIESEIDRAKRSLPRAIIAFNEMQRTYAAHLLLVIVYDDYVRLRDNLQKYMSPTSQLFEKAFNAMSTK